MSSKISKVIIVTLLIFSMHFFQGMPISVTAGISVSSDPFIEYIDEDQDGKYEEVKGTLEVGIDVSGEYYLSFETYWNDTDEIIEYDSDRFDLEPGTHNISVTHDGLAYYSQYRSGEIMYRFYYGTCDDTSCSSSTYIEVGAIIDSEDFIPASINFIDSSFQIDEILIDGKIGTLAISGTTEGVLSTSGRIEIEIFDNSSFYHDTLVSDYENFNLTSNVYDFIFQLDTDILWPLGSDQLVYITIELYQRSHDRLQLVNTTIFPYQVIYSELSTPDILLGDPVVTDQNTVDLNDNGLYDMLVVKIQIQVSRLTDYYIDTALLDARTSYLGFFTINPNITEQDVQAGIKTLTLEFGGGKIRDRGDNSTYSLDIEIRRFDDELIVEDRVELGEYKHTDFAPHDVNFLQVPDVPYLLEDTDGDSYTDWIHFPIEVEVLTGGNYSAYLGFGYKYQDGSISSSYRGDYVSNSHFFDPGIHSFNFSVPAIDLQTTLDRDLILSSLAIYDYTRNYYYWVNTSINMVYDLDIQNLNPDPVTEIGTVLEVRDYLKYTFMWTSNYNYQLQFNFTEKVTRVESGKANLTITHIEGDFPVIMDINNRSLVNDDLYTFTARLDPQSIKVGDWYAFSPGIFDDFIANQFQIMETRVFNHEGNEYTVWYGKSGNFELYYEKETGILLQLNLLNGKYIHKLVATNIDLPEVNDIDSPKETPADSFLELPIRFIGISLFALVLYQKRRKRKNIF